MLAEKGKCLAKAVTSPRRAPRLSLGLRRGAHGAGTWSPPGDVFETEHRHYVTLHYASSLRSGEPTVREPSKCEAWQWWPWSHLPENLFLPVRHLRDQGFRPSPSPNPSPGTDRKVGRLRRVCVFCGSSSGRQPAYRAQAEALGRLLADEDIGLVYGGGGGGLMGALASAMRGAGGQVIGVIPEALVRAVLALRELDDLRVDQIQRAVAEGFIARANICIEDQPARLLAELRATPGQ